MREQSEYVFRSKKGTPWTANGIQKPYPVVAAELPRAGTSWLPCFPDGNETIMERGLSKPMPVPLRLSRLSHAGTPMIVNHSRVVSADDETPTAELGCMLALNSNGILERFGATNENGLDTERSELIEGGSIGDLLDGVPTKKAHA